jgi:hypothetical protein
MNHNIENLGAVIICSVIVIGYILICGIMIFHPPTDNPSAQIMFGGLSSTFSLAINYFTGSTASSKAKDRVIANSPPINPQDPK